MKILLSFLVLSGLFLINFIVSTKKGFSIRNYWFFEIEHFAGGFFMAMFLFQFTGIKNVLIGVGIVTVLWEGLEFILHKPKYEKILKNRFRIRPALYSIKDTALDIALNFGGAAVYFLIKMGFTF